MQLIVYCGTPLGLQNSESKHYNRLDRNFYSQIPQPYSNCAVLEDNTLAVSLANRTFFDLTFKQAIRLYSAVLHIRLPTSFDNKHMQL